MNDRLHKSIYGQTLDEMKEDKGAWVYKQDNICIQNKYNGIEEAIQVLRHIVQVADTSDCNIKEIDGTDEKAINMAISALSTLGIIRSIINLPHIQEDIMRYKMTCEVVDKHTKGDFERQEQKPSNISKRSKR